MDTGSQNEAWAHQIIDALIKHGLDYFCIAPGSRSTPLALAVANHPQAHSTVHFDERGLCFCAVGYGKAAKKPAVVITTSGTAVGNLLPGAMEAYNDHIPLLLLTADRPPELRDCGANQTIDQVKLFATCVRWQAELPCVDERISERYIASTISHAVAMAGFPPAGPVHLNCMFREPLFATAPEPISSKKVYFEQPVLCPSEETVESWCDILSEAKNGVILVGSSSSNLSDAVFPLAERLNWPIFADIGSSLRTVDHPHLITHFDPILKLKSDRKADAIIQFGERFVSKTLGQWLERQTPEFFLHVIDHPSRQDPTHLITHRIISSPQIFTREILFSLDPQIDDTWLSEWKTPDSLCKQKLAELFSSNTTLTEPGLIWEIASFLTKEWSLFLANSMPIRDANQFFFGQCKEIFCNRGVSGIDGNIATICGLAQGTQKPILAVIGDLTLLHDLNSLALLAKTRIPIVLCVVNNGGGGIFSFMPISQRQEAFEELIATAHDHTFASAAALFDIPYFHPQTPAEFGDLLFDQKKNPRSCLIEITTDRNANVAVHEQIIASLGQCLNSANSPVEIPASLH